MKVFSLLAFVAGAAGGYFGARRLIAGDDLAERLPEAARPAAQAARARLLLARERARTVLAEYERERASAEVELTRDYYSRVGRPVPQEPTEPLTGVIGT